MLISPLSIKPSNVYNEKSESCPWSVKQKQTMVWGCWDSGGSRWAVEPGHRVGHRGIQTEEIRGQSSQQRMEERSGAELWEFVIAKCLQRETRGPPVHGWQTDDANMEKYHHTHSLRLVHQSVAAWFQCEDTYFSRLVPPLLSGSEINTHQAQVRIIFANGKIWISNISYSLWILHFRYSFVYTVNVLTRLLLV